MIGCAFSVSKSWMAQAMGVQFDRDYYMDPARRQAIDRRCNEYLDRDYADLQLFFTESNLGRRAYYKPNQALVGGIQPNMILGLLVGAEFIPAGDKDADISPSPLAGFEVTKLPAPESLLEHPLVRLFDGQYRELADKSELGLAPIPPLFWDTSGRTAIHGALTTAQKLFGETVFMDMAMAPEQMAATFDWITDASIVLTRHFAAIADRAITDVHVGECSGCMVSGRSFEQFVAPTLSKYGRQLGPVRLHSCGPSDHLLEAFRQIDNLGSLDVGGETSVARIREAFGPDMPVDIAPLVGDLAAPQPDTLLEWTRRVLEDNAGGPLTIVVHLEQGYPLNNLRALREYVLAR